MSLPTEYDFLTLQHQWYARWLEQDLFTAKITPDKPAYTLVMPPPNVTGILHLGHVLNNVIQDTLARKARMQGKEVCWVPGLDHAAIATEAKVVEMLQTKGISKQTLSRAAFLDYAWEWKEKYGNIILDQLKELGVSCDWKRTRFTLDPALKESVKKAFITLYKKGYIYRSQQMIHWDPKGQTALADEEVVYREVEGKLYYIQYELEEQGYVTIATTRPETLPGDTAICVHPDDERYAHLKGKYAYVPLVGRKIPIIADSYVDKTVGTGCLKVTPAHDANDYEIGKRHTLPIIDILHPDGRLNAKAKVYVGEDRAIARNKIVAELKEKGYLVKVTAHRHQVGCSERTKAIVEPRLSTQWFVSMKELAAPALEAVEKGIIRFHPAKFQHLYTHWMKNIKDWCISRQLWWGHRIPAYYLKDGRFVIAAHAEEALQKARLLTGDHRLTSHALTQDHDVLDTWFSAWLWPIAVFDGIRAPETPLFKYRYPTDDLVTAPDIIFFWVARMIMAGYAFTGQPPFRNVYFTGLVRDKKRKKMAKSLGNSPDPLDLIKMYSADGVRAGMLFCSPAGNDLLFHEKLCAQGARFVHKLWNALRLVKGWQPIVQEPDTSLQQAVHWFQQQYHEVLAQVNEHFAQFRISEALILIYKLIRDAFCAHYLEMIKPDNEHKQMPLSIYQATTTFFRQLMKILHPFMPFITEEIWHQLYPDRDQTSICVAAWPEEKAFDKALLTQATHAFALINRIRHLKAKYTWDKQASLTLAVQRGQPVWFKTFQAYIKKATGICHITSISTGQGVAFVIEDCTFFLPQLKQPTPKTTHASLEKEYCKVQSILDKTNRKLADEQFLSHAPRNVVAYEKQRQAEMQKKLQALHALLTK